MLDEPIWEPIDWGLCPNHLSNWKRRSGTTRAFGEKVRASASARYREIGALELSKTMKVEKVNKGNTEEVNFTFFKQSQNNFFYELKNDPFSILKDK